MISKTSSMDNASQARKKIEQQIKSGNYNDDLVLKLSSPSVAEVTEICIKLQHPLRVRQIALTPSGKHNSLCYMPKHIATSLDVGAIIVRF